MASALVASLPPKCIISPMSMYSTRDQKNCSHSAFSVTDWHTRLAGSNEPNASSRPIALRSSLPHNPTPARPRGRNGNS